MSIQAERQAQEHRAYNDALQYAALVASMGEPCTVYWDGESIFVRRPDDYVPADSQVICVAQKWDDRTVQLRFSGARSEWVKT